MATVFKLKKDYEEKKSDLVPPLRSERRYAPSEPSVLNYPPEHTVRYGRVSYTEGTSYFPSDPPFGSILRTETVVLEICAPTKNRT